MPAGPTAATARSALCAAWWRLERGPEALPEGADRGDWLDVHAALIASRGSGAQPWLPEPCPALLQDWARLPAGMRDLLVLHTVGELPLAEFAQRWSLAEEAPLRAFRAASGALLEAFGPEWPSALRVTFQALAVTPAPAARPASRRSAPAPAGPEPVSTPAPAPVPAPRPRPSGRAARPGPAALAAGLALGLGLGLLGWWLWPLDPAQQRLQAPPAPSFVIEETVPLSSPEFELWADDAEFELLEALDLLLWRAREAGLPLTVAALQAPLAQPLPTPAESAVLAPWAGAWAGLDPLRQTLLASRAARWEALDAAGRLRFEQRQARFAALAPLQRALLRERHQTWTRLPPALQSELAALWADFLQAPAEVQARLRDEFLQLPDAVRRGLLAGKPPELAATARAAFGFVPEEAREPTLEMLRGLGEMELGLLEAMGRRLDSSGRERLRTQLLEAPASERDARVRRAARELGLGP